MNPKVQNCFLYSVCHGRSYCVMWGYLVMPGRPCTGTEEINGGNARDYDFLFNVAKNQCNGDHCVLIVNPMHHRTQDRRVTQRPHHPGVAWPPYRAFPDDCGLGPQSAGHLVVNLSVLAGSERSGWRGRGGLAAPRQRLGLPSPLACIGLLRTGACGRWTASHGGFVRRSGARRGVLGRLPSSRPKHPCHEASVPEKGTMRDFARCLGAALVARFGVRYVRG